jgi:hypothetical protein
MVCVPILIDDDVLAEITCSIGSEDLKLHLIETRWRR